MKTTSRQVPFLFAYCIVACFAARAATLHVWQDSPSPGSPYGDWASAAHTMQEAVDAAQPGDTVLVTNGVYAVGGRAVYGRMTNRVAVDKPITLQSVNGPQVTIIEGAQAPEAILGEGAIRCVYLTNDARLNGFTLTNGATRVVGDWPSYPESSGGGVWCESVSAVLSNCTLTGNSTYWEGGGAMSGTLNNCTLIGNSSQLGGGGAAKGTLNRCTLIGNDSNAGGGAVWGTLNNCTLIGNSANGGGGAIWGTLNNCTLTGNWSRGEGGGASGATLNNCVVYFNTSSSGEWDSMNSSADCTLNYCCTTPTPTNGVGNITNAPMFVDYASGNLRLQSDSLCINSGNNSYATNTTTDFDGNPRIVSGTVDIGAYEYQGAGSVISYAWLQQYGLPTDGTADLTDPDHDGIDNWHEWLASTDPTNRASCVRLTIKSSAAPVEVTFFSSASNLYTLQCCTSLTAPPASSVWADVPGQTDVPGSGDVLTLTDTNPPAPAFYRVSVKFP